MPEQETDAEDLDRSGHLIYPLLKDSAATHDGARSHYATL